MLTMWSEGIWYNPFSNRNDHNIFSTLKCKRHSAFRFWLNVRKNATDYRKGGSISISILRQNNKLSAKEVSVSCYRAFSLTRPSLVIHWNKIKSVYMRKEFNVHRIILVHQHAMTNESK